MAVATVNEPAAGYRWRWHVLAVVLAAEAMDILDTTTVNVAGPSVRRSIGGGTGLVQWLSASYTLALAVLLITGGRLGDRYGQRRMFLLGATGFTAASVACGLSVTPGTLIAARLVQGSFGAVLLPQGIGLLTAAFPAKDLGKAFSAYAPVLSLAAASGRRGGSSPRTAGRSRGEDEGEEGSHTSPLLIYSAPQGLRQAPGRGA